MTTHSNHPITPPQEMVEQWANHSASVHRENGTYKQHELAIATQAARWGADQELEACCEWLGDAPVVYNDNGDLHPGSYLRDARRPKPLSLKQQALSEVAGAVAGGNITPERGAIIRLALEQSEFYCMETWMQKDLEKFRAARRPKPPSLKEQALTILSQGNRIPTAEEWDTIRRALEQLDD